MATNKKKWLSSLDIETYEWIKSTAAAVKGLSGGDVVSKALDNARRDPRFIAELKEEVTRLQLQAINDKIMALEDQRKQLSRHKDKQPVMA